ncbi:MAG: bifunctional diaminohydroxyphosphoribosylaminopyrimidine deaminase/5-amino-6-(5-phosphoribosylamino)uracil reductase RibD [Chryseolinea sp.]
MTTEHTQQDEHFMRRAQELALNGQGFVSPNPLVGSVIVREGRIIGEGWHRKYGEAHAEVNAVNKVQDKALLRESTVYVNLEPCSHFGKTPPCADMLIANHVKRVLISNLDPNPLVAGSGIKKLRDAGIDVTVGVLEKAGQELNKRFFTIMQKHRPYIVLKWAQTADGFIARENHDSKWISNVYSRQLTHKWRTEEDSIMIGTTTAARDNPRLTVRDWTGRNPVRIVIDRTLKLDDSLHLFDGESQTIRYNIKLDEARAGTTLVKLNDQDFTAELIRDLYDRKIQSVLIEGGTHTLKQFLENGDWDEARVFQSATRFVKGIAAPEIRQRYVEHEIMGDKLRIYHHVHEA